MHRGQRGVGVALITVGSAVLVHCSAFSGTDKSATPVDAGTADASLTSPADASITSTFCAAHSSYSLCMDFEDGLLPPKSFTKTDANGDLSIFSFDSKALAVSSPVVMDSVDRTAELVTTVLVPAKVTFGFALTLRDKNPQPGHMELVGFELQGTGTPRIFAVIEDANLVIEEGSGSAVPKRLVAKTLPLPLTTERYEIAFTLGSATDVTVTVNGHAVPTSPPTEFTAVPADAKLMTCAAGMHYLYAPAPASSILLDDIYFTF